MKKLNSKGFSAVEVVLVLVIVGLLGAVGWFVYDKNHNKTTTTHSTPATTAGANQTSAKPAGPYDGWKTYTSSNNLALSFKYPASWTVTENNPSDMCAGQSAVTFTPPASEVESGFKAIGASYTPQSKQNNGATIGSYYELVITKAGQSLPSKCGSDNGSTGVYNWNGISEKYLTSSDEIRLGVLKGKWLTFYGPTDGHTKSNPDTMVVTNNNYGSSSPKFTDSAILSLKDGQYQVVPGMGEKFGQYPVNTTINVTKFKSTDLYKDTVKLLGSAQ